MAPAEAKKEEDEEADKELNDQVQRRNSGTAVAGARDGGKVTLDVTNLVGAGNGGGGHKFAKSFKQVLAEERARVQAAAPLHKLIVSGCQLTDVSLLALSEWPYLRQLSVSRCDELTDTGGVALATNCSRLKVCGSGSYRAPHALTSRRAAWCLLLLQSLSLAYCYGLGNDTISAIAKNCTELRSLSMQGMWNVTDEPFYELGGVRVSMTTCHSSRLYR